MSGRFHRSIKKVHETYGMNCYLSYLYAACFGTNREADRQDFPRITQRALLCLRQVVERGVWSMAWAFPL